MHQIRKSHERGHFDHGWLKTYHTFSFADYYDPKHIEFKTLRVINEDEIAEGRGFGEHPHQNMEILTYILSGELQHRDSLGNGSVIQAGDVQRMTAGTGVRHSEFNASSVHPVHLLQIWIKPEINNLPPSYEQKFFSHEKKLNQLCLVASRHAEENSVTIHQDVKIFASHLKANKKLSYTLGLNRSAWIQLASGSLSVNHVKLEAGDGCAVSEESILQLVANTDCEFLVFDLA